MGYQIVFILGSTRSGTSALRNAICQTRYKGPGEGHFVGLISRVDRELCNYYLDRGTALSNGTMLAKIPLDNLRRSIFSLFSDLYRETINSDFIVDKTPTIDPLLSLSTIMEIWPAARFVFCRRRGIDNILSKQRKFPEDKFINHCQEWAAIIDIWDEKKPDLKGDWIEIDHYDLVTRPTTTATRLASLLGLNVTEEEKIAHYLISERPEQTKDKLKFFSLSDTGWSKEQMTLFEEVCGETMRRCGYGMEMYWSSIESV